jgi:hypothetical protein
MTKSELLNLFSKANPVEPLLDQLREDQPKSFNVKGLVGSSKTFYMVELFKESKKPIVFVLKDKETAAYHLNEFEDFLNKEQGKKYWLSWFDLVGGAEFLPCRLIVWNPFQTQKFLEFFERGWVRHDCRTGVAQRS